MTMEKGPVPFNDLEEYLKGKTLAGQFEAITATEPLVVVSAGAGTGKTWTLAWRFVWSVVSRGTSPRQILTLTFTEKAAREMKERITSIFDLLIMSFPSASNFLNKAREELDEGYISTIHSFAMRVIRESSLHLPIDPESRPLSLPDEEAFWRDIEESLDTLRCDLFSQLSEKNWIRYGKDLLKSSYLEAAINTYGATAVTEFTSKAVSMFSPAGLKPEDLLEISENLKERDAGLAQKLLSSVAAELEELWYEWAGDNGILQRVNIGDGKSSKLATKLIDLSKKYCDRKPDIHDMPEFCRDLSGALKNARGKLKDRIELLIDGTIPELRNRIKKWDGIFDFIEEGCSEIELEARSTLLMLTALCWKAWNEEKERMALLSFDDMIDLAGSALKENDNYAERFCEILVDEFQDTNGLQDDLVRSLWNPEKIRLFIVGDLKQSIYGFRYAKPALFLRYVEEARTRPYGRYINLNKSFRSSDILMEEVNNLFSSLWKGGLGRELPHPYEGLQPLEELEWHERRQETCLSGMSLYIEEQTDNKEEKAGQLREKLARKVGRELAHIRTSGKTIWDRDLCTTRPVEWRDMAILVPTRTQYAPLEKVFSDDLSLPVYFTGSTGYYSRSETLDMVALLKCLINRKDRTSLLHFLSSPFSGLSLEMINDLAESSSWGECSVEALLAEIDKDAPGILDRISRWRKKAIIEGPSRVIEELAADGQFLMKYPPWLRKRAAANIRKAIDIVREYESCRGKDLEGCVDYLKKSAGRGIKLEEAQVTGEDENLIRVMTVHSAKGLEFPVTVLFGCEQSPGLGGAGTSINPSLEMGASLSRLPNDSGGQEERAASSEIYRFLKGQDEDEQWQRLFYVACTRARDKLYICGIIKKSRKPEPPRGSWLEMLGSRLEYRNEFPEKDISEGKTGLNNGKREKDGDRKRSSFIPLPTMKKVALERVSATSFALFSFCPYAYRMKFMQGMDLDWELPSGEGRGGSDLGSLAHLLLEKWNFRLDSVTELIPVDLHEIRNRKEDLPFDLHEPWENSRYRMDLRKWFSTLAACETGKKMASLVSSGKLKKETPFNISTENGIRLTGAIDAMWLENGIIHVRDYKITSVDSAPEDLYRSQMEFYGLVLGIWNPDLDSDIRLYHLKEGKESQPVRSGWEARQTVKDRIHEMAGLAAKGIFEPAIGKCTLCPFRKKCTFHL